MAHSPKRKLFLDLVLSLFRLNGLLVSEGDRMAEALGLTSARWKVIGVVALAHSGMTVPGIARVLGQSRQAVQRICDVMEQDGLLRYQHNPDHKRSVLVCLTDSGQDAYKALRSVQDPWAIESTDDVPVEELETALQLVRRLIHKFDHGVFDTYPVSVSRQTEEVPCKDPYGWPACLAGFTAPHKCVSSTARQSRTAVFRASS